MFSGGQASRRRSLSRSAGTRRRRHQNAAQLIRNRNRLLTRKIHLHSRKACALIQVLVKKGARREAPEGPAFAQKRLRRGEPMPNDKGPDASWAREMVILPGRVGSLEQRLPG